MSEIPGRDESGLRERFTLLRVADRARVPGFEQMLRARPARAGFAWSGLALAAMAGLGLFAAWRSTGPGEGAAMPEVMMQVAAEMPSDFLLEPVLVDVRRDAPAIVPDHNEEVPFL